MRRHSTPARHHLGRRRARFRAGPALVLAALVALGLLATTASAAPATLRLTDLAPTLGRDVTIASPGGGSFTTNPGRLAVRLTSAAGTAEYSGWCIAPQRSIAEDVDYAVDTRTATEDPALGEAGYREAGWLVARSGALIAAAADGGLEAAAIQVAVWQLTGGAADVAEPTSDAALNARTRELRALAAGRALAAELALTATPATTAAGGTAAIDVSGTPGAEVDLSVTAGTGTLSATRVRLDAAGAARAELTATAGPVTITATAAGGELVRIVPAPGADVPQDLLVVRPATVTAVTTVAVAPAAVVPTPVATPTGIPVATPAGVTPAALRLNKRGPAAARAGTRVRYTLTVTNVGTVTARRVVLRDTLPAGTVLPRRPGGARIVDGAVLWRIPAIAPGRSVRRTLVLRLLDTTRGRIDNRATARAENAALVRARALTPVRPARVAPVRTPVVAG